MEFSSHSGIYQLKTETSLPISIERAWSFFSNPQNLSKITPPSMGFTITSSASATCYAGQIIAYKVSPFKGLKSNWITEISHVKEPYFFVDEQRFGPYKMWHHEHHFKETEDGVLMTDIISYKLPAVFLASMVHPIIVKPKLKKIFEYRTFVLKQTFGA